MSEVLTLVHSFTASLIKVMNTCDEIIDVLEADLSTV